MHKLWIEDRYYGCNQLWFSNFFFRQAGCGICASTNLLYLIEAQSANFKIDYQTKESTIKSMNTVSKYVKPNLMGINSSILLEKKLNDLIDNYHLKLQTVEQTIQVTNKESMIPTKYLDFIKQGLESNNGVAFINLNSGSITNLDSWHWVTITSLIQEDRRVLVEISDQGLLKTIDLNEWYLTTSKKGGLVYLKNIK